MYDLENAHKEAGRMEEKLKNNTTEDYDQAEEEVNKENLQKIEQLKIGAGSRAELMLISLGLKRAMEIDLYENNDSKEQVAEILSEVGLICRLKEEGLSGKNTKCKIVVAQDEMTLDELMRVEASRDHEEYGRLMSYPESAIKAFGNKELMLDEADYPSMKGIIFPLKLSKGNYREEVELLRKWSEAIKKYAPDTYSKLSGNDPEAIKGVKKYLADYLEIDIREFQRIKMIEADELIERSEYYKEQYRFLKDNRLENVRIVVVPDDLWKKGSQPSESLAEDFLILIKESYFEDNDKPDEIAWTLHELAHCKYFVDSTSSKKYEEDRQTLAFDDIETEVYPNNVIEKYTFSEQFKFLKEKGKTRERVVEMLKQYYEDEKDLVFFDKLLDAVF